MILILAHWPLNLLRLLLSGDKPQIGECYYCGDCPENKEIEYRCWSCNKFATPLAASATCGRLFKEKEQGGQMVQIIGGPTDPVQSKYELVCLDSQVE